MKIGDAAVAVVAATDEPVVVAELGVVVVVGADAADVDVGDVAVAAAAGNWSRE